MISVAAGKARGPYFARDAGDATASGMPRTSSGGPSSRKIEPPKSPLPRTASGSKLEATVKAKFNSKEFIEKVNEAKRQRLEGSSRTPSGMKATVPPKRTREPTQQEVDNLMVVLFEALAARGGTAELSELLNDDITIALFEKFPPLKTLQISAFVQEHDQVFDFVADGNEGTVFLQPGADEHLPEVTIPVPAVKGSTRDETVVNEQSTGSRFSPRPPAQPPSMRIRAAIRAVGSMR